MASPDILNPSHQIHQPPMSRSNSKPKGILKNAPAPPAPQASTAQHLQWDEENLALTEAQKDSQMKITEPKTPPMSPAVSLPPASPTSIAATGGDSGPSSRRTSFSSTGRASSVRPGSGTSSRSTSFNLPNEARETIRLDGRQPGDEIEFEEEMDEETAAKHAAFIRARGRHYSNEAEAMKMAKALMDEEDEEETVPAVPRPAEAGNPDSPMEDDAGAEMNGVVHAI
ncbi:unnamed protein product [Somion occarium]|uniref:Uncharacterized protein n=1 Tax=Somion occarium TaxID=3059160 RepID=A0ABP1D001_9APHY